MNKKWVSSCSVNPIKCKCTNLPDTFYLEEGPKNFIKELHQEEMANWMRLYSCIHCGVMWAIDEWDKYQVQVVRRVEDIKSWADQDTTKQRKLLLLQSRGGLTEYECIYAGCHEKQVKGVFYCIEHLWKTGARK
jgi:hypothetical protein